MYKRCEINLDDPTTITDLVFERLKQEAASMYEEEDTQMSKLLEQGGLNPRPQNTYEKKKNKKKKSSGGRREVK